MTAATRTKRYRDSSPAGMTSTAIWARRGLALGANLRSSQFLFGQSLETAVETTPTGRTHHGIRGDRAIAPSTGNQRHNHCPFSRNASVRVAYTPYFDSSPAIQAGSSVVHLSR